MFTYPNLYDFLYPPQNTHTHKYILRNHLIFIFCHNGSQWSPNTVANILISKYLLLCSTEESHTGLERHEGE